MYGVCSPKFAFPYGAIGFQVRMRSCSTLAVDLTISWVQKPISVF